MSSFSKLVRDGKRFCRVDILLSCEEGTKFWYQQVTIVF